MIGITCKPGHLHLRRDQHGVDSKTLGCYQMARVWLFRVCKLVKPCDESLDMIINVIR